MTDKMKTKTYNMIIILLILILGGFFFIFFICLGQNEGFASKNSANRYFAEHKEEIQAEIDNRPPEIPPTDYSVVKGNWLDIPSGRKHPRCDGWSLENKVLTYTCEKVNKGNKVRPMDPIDGKIDLNTCKKMEVSYSDKTGKLSCKK